MQLNSPRWSSWWAGQLPQHTCLCSSVSPYSAVSLAWQSGPLWHTQQYNTIKAFIMHAWSTGWQNLRQLADVLFYWCYCYTAIVTATATGRLDYEGSKCHIRSYGEATRQHSGTPGSAMPSRVLSRPTSRSNLEASARSSACQVDWSAALRQQHRSHSDSLETSCRSKSFESDASIKADFTLTRILLQLPILDHTACLTQKQPIATHRTFHGLHVSVISTINILHN